MTSLVWIVVAVIVIVAIIAAVLLSRRQRLRDLPDESRVRYADTWRTIETRFVDHPREAVADADGLALAIYRERGARVDEGRKLPDELERAREHTRNEGEEGQSTEGLRRAMVTYQRIVDDAVGESTRRESEARRREVVG